jgi:hypothetical protein
MEEILKKILPNKLKTFHIKKKMLILEKKSLFLNDNYYKLVDIISENFLNGNLPD